MLILENTHQCRLPGKSWVSTKTIFDWNTVFQQDFVTFSNFKGVKLNDFYDFQQNSSSFYLFKYENMSFWEFWRFFIKKRQNWFDLMGNEWNQLFLLVLDRKSVKTSINSVRKRFRGETHQVNHRETVKSIFCHVRFLFQLPYFSFKFKKSILKNP